VEAANSAGQFPGPISMGVALHHGEAAYSNVGSGVQLDFTVIGPDINLASRIAQLNKVLGEPLLMSQAFVDVLPGRSEPLGGSCGGWVRGGGADLPPFRRLSGLAVQERRRGPLWEESRSRTALSDTRHSG
jgi:class 3 adenylate cyclase